MKKKIFALFLGSLFIGIGCKEKQPFTATQTSSPTILLEAVLLNQSMPVPGKEVQATDPTGKTYTSLSDTNGLAIFNVASANLGTWNISIPQGGFLTGTEPVTFSIGQLSGSVTFQSFPSSLSASLLAGYPFGGGPATLVVQYQQPTASAVPVTLSANGLPSGWTGSFNPQVVGISTGTSPSTLVVNVPGCNYIQPSITVAGQNNSGGTLNANSVTITRDYQVTVSIAESFPSDFVHCDGDTSSQKHDANLTLTTTDDCDVTWTLLTNHGTLNLRNGQYDDEECTSQPFGAVTISSPIGSGSGTGPWTF